VKFHQGVSGVHTKPFESSTRPPAKDATEDAHTVIFLYHHGGHFVGKRGGAARYSGGQVRTWRGARTTSYSELMYQITEKADCSGALTYMLPRFREPISVTDDSELQAMFDFAVPLFGQGTPLKVFLIPAHEESYTMSEVDGSEDDPATGFAVFTQPSPASLPADMLAPPPGTPEKRPRAAPALAMAVEDPMTGFTEDEIADLDLAIGAEDHMGLGRDYGAHLTASPAHAHAQGFSSPRGDLWSGGAGSPFWDSSGHGTWGGISGLSMVMSASEAASSVAASCRSMASVDDWDPSDAETFDWEDIEEEIGVQQTAFDVAGSVFDDAAFPHSPTTPETRIVPWSEVDWEGSERLGEGSFGAVYLVRFRGERVAVKSLEMELFEEKGVTQAASFWAEARILGSLSHPNIVRFYGAISPREELHEAFWTAYSDGGAGSGGGPSSSEPERACLGLLMEYMAGGTLRGFLKQPRDIPWRRRASLALGAARGMAYLHSQSPPVVHFDLKSENLLLSLDRRDVKVADFGLSKEKRATFRRSQVALTGTLPWMAPELVSSETGVTERADVFSFGVVMWELWTRKVPYEGMLQAQILAGLYSGALRPPVPGPHGGAGGAGPPPEGWQALMEACWQTEASLRPPFTEVVERLEAMAA